MSDMTTLLNDLSYIPLNNEHNEPTQGDIGETSNKPTQATRNEFEELYASANEELYPGCDYVTRLDFMANKGYKLPPSYYATKKTFKMIGLGYESIHACEHDCCLFQGKENKDLYFCPMCNTSRWNDSNTPRKKVPKKVLRYFSIIPRLQRLYKSSHTAKEMIWHATRKCTEHSVETIDVASGQKFNMRAMVLWTINDFLARSSLSGWSGQDTAKVRQDLQKLGIRSGLWHGQTKIGKYLKPQAAYSFTPGKRKKFCQFIKGVKLPDGFRSCLKNKVTDKDTNIADLKSHDYPKVS
nr:hypothetical protein [Tanacetum cinerariifolium]